jgi:tetratricopeptide (TPR) repeat protein
VKCADTRAVANRLTVTASMTSGVAAAPVAMAFALLLVGCASAPPQPPPPPPEATTPAMPSEPVVPERAIQQFQMAMAHVDAGRLTDAELELRQLALAYPEFAAPLFNLALLQEKAGKLEAAQQSLVEAIKRDPDNAMAHTELGVVYRRLGRFKEAEAAYLEAVRIAPDYAPAQLNLGVLCDLYLQQPQRALEAFEKYQQLSGNGDKRVATWIAELKGRLGSNPPPQAAENPP